MPDEIRMCLDRILPADEMADAAEQAIEEDPNNYPIISFRPRLGVAPPGVAELAALVGKKWRNKRTLRVHFLDGDPGVQANVEKYAHQWSQYADIKFDFGRDPDAEIRISFEGRGSWSYIGTDALGIAPTEPTMNFGWLRPTSTDDEYSTVVLHEFGHALGCIHEHQHPDNPIPWDKEAVYAYYGGTPNNWSKAKVDQ